jgi:hypothetical protein
MLWPTGKLLKREPLQCMGYFMCVAIKTAQKCDTNKNKHTRNKKVSKDVLQISKYFPGALPSYNFDRNLVRFK